MQKTRWLVLLAHGSRDARWREPVERLADDVRARARAGGEADEAVRVAYLDHCAPDVAAVFSEIAGAGGGAVTVVPVFLSGGGHVQRDLPERVETAARACGLGAVRVTGALGEEPAVLDAMAAAAVALGAAD